MKKKTYLRIRTVVLLCFFLLAFEQVIAQTKDWTEAKNKKGILVLTREVENSEIKEFLGRVELDASISQIFSLLNDPAACSYLYFNCKEVELLTQISNRKSIVYVRNGAPWPVADRDLVMERVFEQNEKSKVGYFKLKKTESANKPSPSGVVRMNRFDAVWRITPLSSGKVKIEYQAHFEPGGSIPQSVINLAITDTPYNTLSNLQKAVDEGKFKEAKLDWVKEFTSN